MTDAEKVAIVDRERAELENMYYILDNFQENDDTEQIMELMLSAIEVRKAELKRVQEAAMIRGTIDYGSLAILPEDRRN